jgi:hypothetical protein
MLNHPDRRVAIGGFNLCADYGPAAITCDWGQIGAFKVVHFKTYRGGICLVVAEERAAVGGPRAVPTHQTISHLVQQCLT